MGVYVKGMEMPKNCCECFLAKLSPTGESIACNYTLSTVPWDGLADDCPLVHVPARGRLIDADALVQDKEINTFEAVFAVAKAPTIIQAEEAAP